MKVKNETKYDTKYLRRLFLACEKHIFQIYLVHGEKKYRQVTVKTHKTFWIGGYAWYNSISIVIKLPPPASIRLGHITRENTVSACRLAQVYLHEVGHNLGKKHKEMGHSSDINVDWWPDENVPLKQVIEKPKPNLVEARANKAQKKLDEHLKKFNREKNLVKKYQQKVRYYEKKMAASTK